MAPRVRHEVLGAGEPLVFITNLATPASAMRAFAPLLDACGCSLILVDHVGAEDTGIESMAADIGTLFDELDIDPWLWGYSQGACVAQELALLRPDRIRGAVLVATRGRQSRFFSHYLLASGDAAVARPSVAACLSLLATMTPEMLHDDDQVEFALRRAVDAHQTFDPAVQARSLRASAAYDSRLDALSGVRVPCLVVSFGGDVVCPPALGREVAGTIPGCGYTEIPGAGHSGLVSHATEVLAAVTGFVERHRSTRPLASEEASGCSTRR